MFELDGLSCLQTSPPLLYSEALANHAASPSTLIQLPGLESAAKSFGGLPSIVRPSPLWQRRKPPAAEDPQQSQTPSQVDSVENVGVKYVMTCQMMRTLLSRDGNSHCK